MRLERTLWVEQENERRKGRKGRKPPTPIRCVGFRQRYQSFSMCAAAAGLRRLARRKPGANRRKVAETPFRISARGARNCPPFYCLTQGVPSKHAARSAYRKLPAIRQMPPLAP